MRLLGKTHQGLLFTGVHLCGITLNMIRCLLNQRSFPFPIVSRGNVPKSRPFFCTGRRKRTTEIWVNSIIHRGPRLVRRRGTRTRVALQLNPSISLTSLTTTRQPPVGSLALQWTLYTVPTSLHHTISTMTTELQYSISHAR